jgi:hypothetical protein
MEVGGGLSLGLKHTGVESENAVAPMVFAGPLFDRVMIFAEGLGDRREGASMAELEESQKSAEGARRLAGLAGEHRR